MTLLGPAVIDRVRQLVAKGASGMNTPLTLLGPEVIDSLISLALNAVQGPYVEIGVYKGGSAWWLAALARQQVRELHLFDTFTGIPHKGPYDEEHEVGDFSDTSYESVKSAIPDAIFHVGVFPETLQNIPPINPAFVHVDCDQLRGR